MTAKVFLKNRWEELLLLLLAVLFFLLRFLYLSQVPFINDEPALQLLLEKHMASGTLPVLGLAGSVGLRYGPSALWLYWPIRLFTHDVNFLTAAYCCYFGIGFALLFLAIKRSLGGRVAAWTLLFASSSVP